MAKLITISLHLHPTALLFSSSSPILKIFPNLHSIFS